MRVGHDLYRMLRAGMPDDWTPGERLVALIIADACNDRTHSGYIAIEQLCEETGYTPKALSDVLRRLSRHGYEMRVAHGNGKDGRPVFAARGHATEFRAPIIPPRTKARSGPALSPVDNPSESPRHDGTITQKGPVLTAKAPVLTGDSPGPDRPPTPITPPTPNNPAVDVSTPPVEDTRARRQPIEQQAYLAMRKAQ